MKMRKLLSFALLSAGFFGLQTASAQQSAVTPEQNFTRFPVKKVVRHSTVDLAKVSDPWMTGFHHIQVMPPPGEEMELEKFNEMKRQLNDAKQANRQANPSTPSQKTNADAPVLGHNFFGNTFDGIPNDNSMCVSMSGRILSATNSRLDIYKNTGQKLATKTLASFFSNSTLVYDPRVTFDPEWGRFVLVYLSGATSSLSTVVVAFSQTADPLGQWNVYTLDGNPNPGQYGNVWTDYPQIGLSKSELFVTGNLFYDTDQSAGVSYIWQIDKEDGYNGDTLDIQEWGAAGTNNKFSLTVCEGNTELYGPNMFFISTPNSPFSASAAIFLHEITDTIGGNPQLLTYPITSNTLYGVAPDADQKGTTRLLDTRGTRIRAAYYQNERIQFGMNATRQNKCEIYYGTVSGLANPSFAAATGQYVNIDSFDIGYPSMAYGGLMSSGGVNSTLLCFNFSSPDHYPGNACVLIDTTNTVSAPTVCKYGFTYIQQMSSSPERWGDYAECAPKHDNPGEFWTAGYVGYNNSGHYHGTWISQLFLNGAAPIAIDPSLDQTGAELELYPNPTADVVRLRITIPESQICTASVLDLNGNLVKMLVKDMFYAGEAELSFATEALSSGVYFVVVTGEKGELMRENLVVQK